MTFTIHRGAKEVGGSCVEVCTKTTRLIVDFGLPLVNEDRTPFDSSEIKDASPQDLVSRKILPDIPALYGEQPDKNTAIAISHAHQDHYGLINFVDKKIPVYLGKATLKIIELTDVFMGRKCAIEKAVFFESEKPFVFGDIEVTPYLMDHAAFDAYAFLIRGEGQSLFYSGDFRAHGRKNKLFYRFLHNAPQNVDWLLLEGTTISRTNKYFPSENQLEKDFVDTFKNTGGINLIHVSGQNIDRLVTIDRACKSCGKIFVVDFYIANVLEELKDFARIPHPSDDFPEIKVFFRNG